MDSHTWSLALLVGGATGTICVFIIAFYLGRSRRGLVKSHICGDSITKIVARSDQERIVCTLPKGHDDYLHETHLDHIAYFWVRESDGNVIINPVKE